MFQCAFYGLYRLLVLLVEYLCQRFILYAIEVYIAVVDVDNRWFAAPYKVERLVVGNTADSCSK